MEHRNLVAALCMISAFILPINAELKYVDASRLTLIGKVMTPTLGSIVQKGKFAACALALDRQLKRVDLPTLGSPTIPHCKAIEYLSFLILSVRQASAKCRCPREDGRYTVVRKCKDTNKPRAKANLFAFCPGEVF